MIFSFQSTYEQSNRLEKSYQTILLTHHSRPAFRQNLIKAFGILNQTKGMCDNREFGTPWLDLVDGNSLVRSSMIQYVIYWSRSFSTTVAWARSGMLANWIKPDIGICVWLLVVHHSMLSEIQIYSELT